MNGFFALHRLLMEIASRISKYIQSWTTDQVPDETVLKHNFKDGQGAVNAVPYDDMSASTALADANAKDGLVNDSDETSSDCTLYRFTVQQVLVDGTDDISSGNSVAAASCTPTPIVIEIDNEVQAMIDHIVPVRTQALPGQDYLFKVYYRQLPTPFRVWVVDYYTGQAPRCSRVRSARWASYPTMLPSAELNADCAHAT